MLPAPMHKPKHALISAALFQRDDVGNDHHGQAGDSAVGQTGEAAKDEEHSRVLAPAAVQLADCQHRQRG